MAATPLACTLMGWRGAAGAGASTMYVISREIGGDSKPKPVADCVSLYFMLVVSRTSSVVCSRLSDLSSSIFWEIHSHVLSLGLLVSDLGKILGPERKRGPFMKTVTDPKPNRRFLARLRGHSTAKF
jgi:hypothetical protein